MKRLRSITSMKNLIYTLILFLGISETALSQDYTEQAKTYFANYVSIVIQL